MVADVKIVAVLPEHTHVSGARGAAGMITTVNGGDFTITERFGKAGSARTN